MKNKDLILYIHGWNSYKDARKAVLLKNEINSSKNFEVDSITLKSHPKEAIQQLSNYIEDHKEQRKVHLIGSSLGGYYATFLSEKYNLKAAMINPAVWAYKIFKNDMGSNENLNTGEKYLSRASRINRSIKSSARTCTLTTLARQASSRITGTLPCS